jgi:uncharacterized membrane protein
VVGPFIAGLVGLVMFVLIERRASEPIVPLELLGNRIFVTAVGAFFVVGAVLFSVTIYLPVYLQDVRGNTPTISGVTMLSFTGAWVVVAVITGRLVTRNGHADPAQRHHESIRAVRDACDRRLWHGVDSLALPGGRAELDQSQHVRQHERRDEPL